MKCRDPVTLKTYTTLSWAEFCYTKLDQTPQISPYPSVAIFQKLLRLVLSLLLN